MFGSPFYSSLVLQFLVPSLSAFCLLPALGPAPCRSGAEGPVAVFLLALNNVRRFLVNSCYTRERVKMNVTLCREKAWQSRTESGPCLAWTLRKRWSQRCRHNDKLADSSLRLVWRLEHGCSATWCCVAAGGVPAAWGVCRCADCTMIVAARWTRSLCSGSQGSRRTMC